MHYSCNGSPVSLLPVNHLLWHPHLSPLCHPLIISWPSGHINLLADISFCSHVGTCREPFTIYHSEHTVIPPSWISLLILFFVTDEDKPLRHLLGSFYILLVWAFTLFWCLYRCMQAVNGIQNRFFIEEVQSEIFAIFFRENQKMHTDMGLKWWHSCHTITKISPCTHVWKHTIIWQLNESLFRVRQLWLNIFLLFT